MPRFARKPAFVDAFRLGSNDAPDWLLAALELPHDHTGAVWCGLAGRMVIATPKGQQIAQPDDWIVRDLAGNIEAIRADLFHQLYEPAA